MKPIKKIEIKSTFSCSFSPTITIMWQCKETERETVRFELLRESTCLCYNRQIVLIIIEKNATFASFHGRDLHRNAARKVN